LWRKGFPYKKVDVWWMLVKDNFVTEKERARFGE
jgi:hypothetical protein